MRTRAIATATKPLPPKRRGQTGVGCGDGGQRDRATEQPDRPAAPELSTFRRVAVFVPLRTSGAEGDA